MKVIACDIPGPLLIEPLVHEDARGFFLESWNARDFREAGIEANFVQDNHSRSQKGVLRGLHFQAPQPQAKLVRVTNGSVFDVIVDLRRSSDSFGKWFGFELSASNRRMLWVPEGFAHGFLALEDETDLLYKCTEYYAPAHDRVLAWDDPEIAIDWPLYGIAPILSDKDRKGRNLTDLAGFQ